MENKPTILVVGASRGLGLALAEAFCMRNWHVIATVRGTSEGLEALKARFPSTLEEETVDICSEADVAPHLGPICPEAAAPNHTGPGR